MLTSGLVLPAQPTRSDERYTTTKCGPSAELWNQYRGIIIELYRTKSLEEVIGFMIREYNFSATKRMYDKRFRAWGINKNLPKAQKEKLLTWYSRVRLLEADANEIELDECKLQKALRYDKGQRQSTSRNASRQRRTVSTTLAPFPIPCSRAHYPKSRPRESLEPSHSIIASAAKADTEFEEWPSTEDEATPASTPSSWSDVSVMDIIETAPDEQPSRHDLVRFPPKPPISPILSRPTDRTALLLLQNVQYYCERQLDLVSNDNTLPDALGFGCSSLSAELRDNLSNGLYLLKISSVFPDGPRRAWPALHRACAAAEDVMCTEPFDLLRVILATLSPTNTRCHLALRAKLLKHLGNIANNCLGPMHPLPAICEQLQCDQDNPAVADRGLVCMSDVFSARLGAFHDTTLRLQSSLIALARRSGDFDSAEQTASRLFLALQVRLGERSQATRRAARDLAHIKMARKQYAEALRACDVVLGQPVSSSPGAAALEVAMHEDDLAIQSMEDVAEIFERLGDIEAAVRWLRFAAERAVPLWGREAIATVHIVDKLALVLRDIGWEEDAARWAALVDLGR